MRCRQGCLFVTVLGLALGMASSAEAEQAVKHNKPPASGRAAKHRPSAVVAAPAFRYQGGVPSGPLYNGQDYIGDDPDPNIRSYLIRDMSRYGGND